MRARRKATAVLAVFIVALALAGCGGGKRLTREQFAVRVNALCDRYRPQAEVFERLAEAHAQPTLAQGARWYAQWTAGYEDLISRLSKLKPPSDEKEAVSRLIELANKQAQRYEQAGSALANGDVAGVNRIFSHTDAERSESIRLSKELGVNSCLKG